MDPKDSTYTITFGEQGENHYGMQKVGNGLAKSGFTCSELKKACKYFEGKGLTCELIDLNEACEEAPEEACVLVVRKGINFLLGNEGKDDDLLAEMAALEWDRKAFMYGRVVNKKARYNLCFSDESQEPDYENKKGRIIAFSDLPLTRKLREEFYKGLGNKAKNLQAEGNWYYDPDKCFIGYHGDFERKIVIAVRIGKSFPLAYHWFYKGKPVGEEVELVIDNGDVYFMSEKTTGNDWKKKNIYTLRHAAGDKKYRVIKSK